MTNTEGYGPHFKQAIRGEAPSARNTNKLQDVVSRMAGGTELPSRLIGKEIFDLIDYDATKKLYTGTRVYNDNPVHVDYGSGSHDFIKTDPADDREEIVDPMGIVPCIGCRVFAFFHPQSGYWIVDGPSRPAVLVLNGVLPAASATTPTFCIGEGVGFVIEAEPNAGCGESGDGKLMDYCLHNDVQQSLNVGSFFATAIPGGSIVHAGPPDCKGIWWVNAVLCEAV